MRATLGAVPSGVNDEVTKAYVDLERLAMSPGGNTLDTGMRNGYTNVNASPSSGTLFMAAIALPKNYSVGHITFVSSNTAAGTPTHWWFSLYDSSRVQLATTADQTTTAWASSIAKTLAVATIASGAASSFTTTYAGLHYLGFLMTATTPVNLPAIAMNGALNLFAPLLCGVSTTGLTTPTGFPTTATAITTGSTTLPYAYVGA